MKPHEQEWRQCHQESRTVETSDGYRVAEAYPAGDGGYAEVCDVARLIAAVPDMARALLGEMDPDGHVIACGNESSNPDDCSPRCRRVTAALRKGGVTP